MPARPVTVQVEGRALRLTNLDKVLYPASGFTKGDVLDYYRRVAPALLPHLARRPVTFLRAPDGVGGARFYEKRRPRGSPPWLETVVVGGRRGTIDYPLVESLAALMFVANLAVLELHVPQWKVDGSGVPQPSDLLVFDLDPGAPATLAECCVVALEVRDALVADGLHPLAKLSGSKGLQLYARRPEDRREGDPSELVRRLAERLEADRPDLVVSSMRKSLRNGRVLLDWSQNSRAKTTVAPYSLRARDKPTVSCPLRWEEVEATAGGADPARLRFTPADALARLERHGDLFTPLLGPRPAGAAGAAVRPGAG